MSRKIRESFSSISSVKEELVSIKTEIEQEVIAKGGIVTGGFSAFSTDISTIPSGAPTSSTEKDVNFYDYDGTFVKGYTFAEAHALTSMPDAPDHSANEIPLTFQEWNYTLEEVNAATLPLMIGATYITSDGKTTLKVRATGPTGLGLSLHIKKTVASDKIYVDFGGDEPTVNVQNTTTIIIAISLPAAGEYTVKIWLDGSGTYTLGHGTSTACLLNGTTQKHMVLEAYLGANIVLFNAYGMSGFYALRVVTIPAGVAVSNSSNSAFSNCDAVNALVLPRGSTVVPNSFIQNGFGLRFVSMPKTVTSVAAAAFSKCTSLYTIVFPEDVIDIGNNAFQDCYSLTSATMSDSVTSVGTNVFNGCWSLRRIKMSARISDLRDYMLNSCMSLLSFSAPADVSIVRGYAFYNCRACIDYDFSLAKAVPVLSNVNAFNQMLPSCQIKVPAALRGNWVGATNWTTFVSYIVGV